MTRVKLNICLKDFPTPKSPLLREVRWDGHSQIGVPKKIMEMEYGWQALVILH